MRISKSTYPAELFVNRMNITTRNPNVNVRLEEQPARKGNLSGKASCLEERPSWPAKQLVLSLVVEMA